MDWRTVVAMLANPDTRRALARTVAETEDGLTDAQYARALGRLREAGLLDGAGTVDADALRTVLKQNAGPPQRGVERFLTPAGRLLGLPSKPAERLELLALLASRALRPGEVVPEQELNRRLASFDDDVATLRRLMVEAELLERTPSGTEYALVEAPPSG
ncbi:MAG: DUF2087 domain-containing protein [Propionicimonas sp.]|nr:DUF2087 domain-containing protein [Propionicimonas sp.]